MHARILSASVALAALLVSGCGDDDRGPTFILDSGTLWDAGRPFDGGRPFDAGTALDGGQTDAGTKSRDSGMEDTDAGMGDLDAGPDSGMGDAGMMDAGMADAGMADAGMADAGMAGDAGACLALPTTAGGSVVLMGTLGSGSTWERPEADFAVCDSETPTETVLFETFTFCNSGAMGSYDIALDGADSSATLTLDDPFLVVYSGATIPADVRACLAANDDWDIFTSLDSRVESVPVGAGASITVVATSFDLDAAAGYGVGTYELTITRR
jgi:hypothetical protein